MSFRFPFFIEDSWRTQLQDELSKPYIADLAAFVVREYDRDPGAIFPPQQLIFNALLQTPFDHVKVVIVGQDPYHAPGQAHGLSFSVPSGIAIPRSLANIFKELNTDLHIPVPQHGGLVGWATQGVLLLNATLTVRQGDPMSHHGRGWERLTDAILQAVYSKNEPVVFLLWGKSAQEKGSFLKNSSHKLVLMAAHPSPFSAERGFFGCRHFSKTNAWLKEHGVSPVNWGALNP